MCETLKKLWRGLSRPVQPSVSCIGRGRFAQILNNKAVKTVNGSHFIPHVVHTTMRPKEQFKSSQVFFFQIYMQLLVATWQIKQFATHRISHVFVGHPKIIAFVCWIKEDGTLTYRQTLAVDLVSPACIVAKCFDAAVHVNEEGLQEWFPCVQSFQGLKKIRKTRITLHNKIWCSNT